MTKKYLQLNQEQRYEIGTYLKAGKSQTFIANALCVHKSTISRELSRNVAKRGLGAKVYDAKKAQIKTMARHVSKPKYTKFNDVLKKQMLYWIAVKKYSPEFVAAQWVRNGKAGVSHECIYQFIWQCKHTNKRINKAYKNLYKHLKHGKRRRKRGNYKDTRGIIPNRVSIDKRPKIVNEPSAYTLLKSSVAIKLQVSKFPKSITLTTPIRP